jgi:hypothetical protein
VTLHLANGVVIGGQYAVGIHRSVFQADDADAVTSWMLAEASLLIGFEWPGKERHEPEAVDDQDLPDQESTATEGTPDSEDARGAGRG